MYNAIKTVYESEDMSNEEKQETRKQLIEDFCKANQIETEEDLKYITGILERMKQSEDKIKEERRNKDFYDETR